MIILYRLSKKKTVYTVKFNYLYNITQYPIRIFEFCLILDTHDTLELLDSQFPTDRILKYVKGTEKCGYRECIQFSRTLGNTGYYLTLLVSTLII